MMASRKSDNPLLSMVFIPCALSALSGCDGETRKGHVPNNPDHLANGAIVQTQSGDVQGYVEDGGVYAFKGIPFAAPPLGALRWQPPQRPDTWQGVRPATKYGASCPQNPFPDETQPVLSDFSEDCLTLNIWVSADEDEVEQGAIRASKRPVMVWIHGGGLLNGGSATAGSDGAALARKGVVLVSINYRLGRLGFFAHPDLFEERSDGRVANYGILDQIAALQWVQDNIAGFGGDPDNVTVFGESAGGGSVSLLMTSPLAEGLFQKAIIQSGGGRSEPIMTRGESYDGGPSMEQIGLNFAHSVSPNDPSVSALRQFPVEEIIGNVDMLSNMDRSKSVNWSIDGAVIPTDPISALLNGDAHRVPLIVGATDHELEQVPMIGALGFYTLSQFGTASFKVQEAYSELGLEFLTGDAIFTEPARYMAELSAGNGSPTYHYSFSYVQEALRQDRQGASHASDIPFVFGNADSLDGATSEDRRFADRLASLWASFAKTGDPSDGQISWPSYGPLQPSLNINSDFNLIYGFRQIQLDVLEEAYSRTVWKDKTK